MATIRLDTRKLDALARGLEVGTGKALGGVAREVQAVAMANIVAKNIIDTGALLNRMATTWKSKGVFWVHDGVEYGVYHELGTHKIGARPFMVPAVELVGQYVGAIVVKELFE